MNGFVDDIGRLTEGNTDFRRVLYTGEHLQLVLMTLAPGEEIGAEVHEDRDQFFRVEAGDGEITIDGTTQPVTAEFAMIVPAGARHNVRCVGSALAQALHHLRPARAPRRRRVRHEGGRRGRPRALRRRDHGVAPTPDRRWSSPCRNRSPRSSSSRRADRLMWPAGSRRHAMHRFLSNWPRARRLVVVGAIGVVFAIGSTPTPAAAGGPRVGPVRVFASVAGARPPVRHRGRRRTACYVSTSAGDFFADPANGGHRNSDGERVFTYDAGRCAPRTRRASRRWPDADDGPLRASPSTATPGPRHALYVADMNGRILRVPPRRPRPEPPRGVLRRYPRTRVSPATGCSRCGTTWCSTRPATSTCPTTSRASGASARMATPVDLVHRPPPRRATSASPAGPLGARIDPSGQLAVLLDHRVGRVPARRRVIYRIRLVDHPTAADLQLVHRFPLDARRQAPPQPGPDSPSPASGNLYVSLLGPNQVADPRSRPGTRSGASRARCSTRRGGSPSSASRSWSRTATSSRATTPPPGRCSRCSSGSGACRSTSRGCPPAEADHVAGARRAIPGEGWSVGSLVRMIPRVAGRAAAAVGGRGCRC